MSLDGMRSLVLILLALTACGDNIGGNAYMWDDRRLLCSEKADDLNGGASWDAIERNLDEAQTGKWAVMFHAHRPTVTISLHEIDQILSAADARHLDYVTFRELDEASPRGASLALAFDDNSPDEWMLIRDLLDRHHARVTFFVSRYALLTPAEQDEIRVLAADGHDIEAHTANHFHAPIYVAEHGLDAYLGDEALPSSQVLTDAGFDPPRMFAYPFGEHSSELDGALLEHFDKVRTTMSECPW